MKTYIKPPMYCPLCKRKLIVLGKERLETIDEHVSGCRVSLKDKYECINVDCETFNNLCWNRDGEVYGSIESGLFKKWRPADLAPYGSFQRKMNIEIYKKDENKSIQIKKWRIEWYYTYKSNENGDILDRKGHVRFWYNHCLYISGIHMLIFSIKQFHNKKAGGFLKDLKPLAEWESKTWWRRWSHNYQKMNLTIFK